MMSPENTIQIAKQTLEISIAETKQTLRKRFDRTRAENASKVQSLRIKIERHRSKLMDILGSIGETDEYTIPSLIRQKNELIEKIRSIDDIIQKLEITEDFTRNGFARLETTLRDFEEKAEVAETLTKAIETTKVIVGDSDSNDTIEELLNEIANDIMQLSRNMEACGVKSQALPDPNLGAEEILRAMREIIAPTQQIELT